MIGLLPFYVVGLNELIYDGSLSFLNYGKKSKVYVSKYIRLAKDL